MVGQPSAIISSHTAPTAAEMAEMKSILNAVGLNNVLAQTGEGYIGP